MAESKNWDFQRFWQTLDYFDSIPLWSCLQKLLGFGEDKKIQLTNPITAAKLSNSRFSR